MVSLSENLISNKKIPNLFSSQKSNLLYLKFFQIDSMSENLSSDKENFEFNLISNFRFRKFETNRIC